MLKKAFIFIGIILFVLSVSASAAVWKTSASSMVHGTYFHTATLLPNGTVLITGGWDNLIGAALYYPFTGTFETTGSLNSVRVYSTATLLPSGKVLIAGGVQSWNGDVPQGGNTAELYDPSTKIFTLTGSMTYPRNGATATLLPNGTVLITGGYYSVNPTTTVYPLTAEVYSGGSFTPTGSMVQGRTQHTATLLPSGNVLIAGGYYTDPSYHTYYLSSAEVYSGGTFTATGSMKTARDQHTATLLPNGTVFIAGGTSDGNNHLASAEVYSGGTFTATGSMANGRYSHTAALLPSGKVLIAGGLGNGGYLNSAELYDPSSGQFTSAGAMVRPKAYFTATLLPDGKVLEAAGYDGNNDITGVEFYDPVAGSFETVSNTMTTTRDRHTATLLANGKVLLTGGFGNTAELYDPGSKIFSATTGQMSSNRWYHTATLLPNGKVLIVGGSTTTNSTDLYNPVTNTFESTGSMPYKLEDHTATLLSDGTVLIAGGFDPISGSGYNNAEIYYPSINRFYPTTNSMSDARSNHSATLLPNNKVLIAGGYGSGSSYLSSAELYDPTLRTFSSITPGMASPRVDHTATLLPNGKVLLAGGQNAGGILSSAELYDPSTNLFSSTGPMLSARVFHDAVLLPNGKVLIGGGTGGIQLDSVELYDPASGTFETSSALKTGRMYYTATLLANGNILVAGGFAASGSQNTAELARYTEYDYTTYPSMQPVISSFSSRITPGGGPYTITGTGFKGTSEASGGNGSANSPTNYPRVYLQKADTGNFGGMRESGMLIDCSSSIYQYPISDTSIQFMAPSNLPGGYYLLTVVANAVPSDSKVASYEPPAVYPPPPSAPTGFIGTAESTSTIHWSWNDVAFEDGYRLLNQNHGVICSMTPDTITTVEGGLTPNLLCMREISAYNPGGSNESSASRYTLAATPAAPSVFGGYDVTNGYHCDITVNAGGNPGGTYYAVTNDGGTNWLQSDGTTSATPYWATTTSGWYQKNLSANTAYSYEVKARNGDNIQTSLSSAGSDTTPPAAPTGLVTSNITQNTATSTWGAAAAATSYLISRGTDSNATNIGVSSVAGTSFGWSGLSPLMKYYWKVASINSNGTGEYSSTASYTTLPLPPPAPTGFTGTASSATSITWSWNDVSTREDGYRLLRQDHSVIFSMAANTTTTVETGLTPNLLCTREISAYNLSGSAESSASRYTLAATPAAPSVFGGYSEDIHGATTGYRCDITVNAGGNPGGTYYAVTNDGGTNWLQSDGTTSATPYWATTTSGWYQKNLSANTAYSYEVMARNGDNIQTSLSSAGSDTTPPAAPTGLATTNITTSSADCAWQAADGANSYWISWGTDVNATNGGANVASTPFHIGGQTPPGSTQYWKVRAISSANGSGEYSSISSYTLLPLTPLSPTDFNGFAESTTWITWSWDDVSGEDGYQLLDQDHNVIFTLPADTVSTDETGLNHDQQYTRYIRAYNAGGSAEAGPKSVFTLADAPVNPQISTGYDTTNGYYINISWESGGAESGFFVYRTSDWALVYDGTGTTTVDANLAANTTYIYYIFSYNGDGIYEYATAYDTTPPSAPAGLTTNNITSNSADSAWDAVGEATSYLISWGTDPDASNGGEITTTDPSYSWTTLTPSTNYYWKVAAVNGYGTGEYSGISSFTALPGVPLAPSYFIGTAESTTSIVWAWENVAGADGYQLLDQDRTPLFSLAKDASDFIATGGTANTQYTWYIRAYNTGGSAETGPTSVYTLADAPVNPQVSAGYDTTNGYYSNISWESGGAESGFFVYRTSDWTLVYDGTGTTTVDANLAGNTLYAYYIFSYNGDYIWEYVSVVDVTPPTAPAGLTTNNITSNSADSAWDTVGEATSYLISWGTDPDATNGGEITTTDPSYSWTTLTPLTTYYWKVAAVNDIGTGEYSGISSFSTLALSTLGTPEGLVASNITQTSALITWEPVSGALAYVIGLGTAPDDLQQVSTTVESFLWGSLSPSTEYYWQVIAINNEGHSDWSSIASFETLAAGPAPTVDWAKLNGKLINLRGTNYTSPSPEVEIHFTASKGIVDLYGILTSSQDPMWTQYMSFTLEGGTIYSGTWEGTEKAACYMPGTYTLACLYKDAGAPYPSSVSYTVTISGRGPVQMVGGIYNYPNPFKPVTEGTTIQYMLSKDTPIMLLIYDMTGREVKRMKFGSGTNGGSAGINQVYWDGVTIGGWHAGNGMYYCQILSGTRVIGTIKMVVMNK